MEERSGTGWCTVDTVSSTITEIICKVVEELTHS